MRSLITKEQSPQEFAKEHWKEIFAVSGTLAGAVILLLIRYHRRRSRAGRQDDDSELLLLEEDARDSNRLDIPLILDLMPDVKKIIPDVDALSEQLAQGLPEETEEPEDHGSKSMWQRLKRGNPKEVMKTVGKVK